MGKKKENKINKTGGYEFPTLVVNGHTLSKYESMIVNLCEHTKKVPYLQGKPGGGKTTIIQNLASKIGAYYEYFSVTTLTPESLGLIPVKTEYNGQECFDIVTALWVLKANERAEQGIKTYVLLDEFGHADEEIQKTVLGLFSERRIGSTKLHDNIKFITTGNLGKKDGNPKIRNFMSAVTNRLSVINYDMTIDEWIDNYANKNVLPQIINFIKNNPTYFWEIGEDISDKINICSPRAWTQFSDLLKGVLGLTPKIDDMLMYVSHYGDKFISAKAQTEFIQYLEGMKSISLEMLLDDDLFYSLVDEEGRLMLDRSIQLSLINELGSVYRNNLIDAIVITNEEARLKEEGRFMNKFHESGFFHAMLSAITINNVSGEWEMTEIYDEMHLIPEKYRSKFKIKNFKDLIAPDVVESVREIMLDILSQDNVIEAFIRTLKDNSNWAESIITPMGYEKYLKAYFKDKHGIEDISKEELDQRMCDILGIPQGSNWEHPTDLITYEEYSKKLEDITNFHLEMNIKIGTISIKPVEGYEEEVK